MPDNPYRAPEETPSVPEDAQARAALAKIRASIGPPAVALILLAALALAVDILWGIAGAVIFMNGPTAQEDLMFFLPLVTFTGIWTIAHLVVLDGALKMRAGRSHARAKRAAILAMVPIISPLVWFGIPFGIWAMIVLRRDDVRSAFRAMQPLERKQAADL